MIDTDKKGSERNLGNEYVDRLTNNSLLNLKIRRVKANFVHSIQVDFV